MSTLSSTITVKKSDARTTRTLMSLRTSHTDVEELTQKEFNIDAGSPKTIVAKSVAYLHIRDELSITITVGEDSIVLDDQSGILALPFPCTITLTAPEQSTLSHFVTTTYA